MSESTGMLNRLARRVLLMIGRGVVTFTDDSGPVQLVQIQVNALETIDGVMRPVQFGFSSVMPNGTDIAFTSIAGDRSNSIATASNHQPSRPRGLQPGESMIYTQDGKQIYLTASGGILVKANGQPVEVDGATTVTIIAATEVLMDTPMLKVTGDILDNCNTNTRTMEGMRTVANGHTHKVVNVQTGGSTIETDPPDQDE